MTKKLADNLAKTLPKLLSKRLLKLIWACARFVKHAANYAAKHIAEHAMRYAAAAQKYLPKSVQQFARQTLPQFLHACRHYCRHYARRVALSALAAAAVGALAFPATLNAVDSQQRVSWGIDASMIAAAISPDIAAKKLPDTIALPNVDIAGELDVHYTIDAPLQTKMQELLQHYRPDYGVVVAIDADSGRVLAMTDGSRDGDQSRNLIMRNSYPAASISKIVTAIAAIDGDKARPDSVIPFNGKITSLYKKNVLRHRNHKWTRHYSFAKSFALSVNSVFGRVGAVTVGGKTMFDYARRLGFNGQFASDFSFANGVMAFDPNDVWEVAEMSSGYTTRNTLSPLHASVLAASVVNGGDLVAPVLVDSITGPNGVPIYLREQTAKSRVMRETTARQVAEMMQTTVKRGSAKSEFLGFNRSAMKDVAVGGKTGSLTGFSPRGRYDWFVGFAERGGDKIAFAVLCINKKFWQVKSATLARELVEFYFGDNETIGAKVGATVDGVAAAD